MFPSIKFDKLELFRVIEGIENPVQFRAIHVSPFVSSLRKKRNVISRRVKLCDGDAVATFTIRA